MRARSKKAIAGLLVLGMAGANIGCAHKQLTTKQVVGGAAVIVGLSLLLYLAVEQCNKGAAYCDNMPNP